MRDVPPLAAAAFGLLGVAACVALAVECRRAALGRRAKRQPGDENRWMRYWRRVAAEERRRNPHC